MSWIDDAKRLAAATVLVRERVDDPALAKRRAKVCHSCPELQLPELRCKVCGCYLKVKVWAKVNRSPRRPMGEVTHCPLGKWEDLAVANHYRALDGKPPL